MASTFRVLETRRLRSSGSRPTRSVSGRVVQCRANEAALSEGVYQARTVSLGGGRGPATASRTPPFGSPFVTFSLPVLTHDGGIISSFAISCPETGPRGPSERRTGTAEDRGDDSCHRG